MKKLFLSLAIAGAALVGFSSNAEAGPRFSIGYGYSTGHYNGGHYNRGHGSIHSYTGHSFRNSHHGHCSTPRVISTCVVNRQTVCRRAYDSCGHLRTYHYTVVTYRDHYSNGTCRTYTRTHY